MNANQIHIGHEYAICPYPKPNGNAFIPNAIRFVAYRTFGEQEYGNKRLTMFVEGFDLDRENGTPIRTSYSKYRVRDVIEDWEEYEDRADQHEVEQARINREREERIRREREEYERRRIEQESRWQKEREEREQARVNLQRRLEFVKNGLTDRGLRNFTTDVNGNVTISLVDLEAWLKSLTKVECMTCHRDLIMLELP